MTISSSPLAIRAFERPGGNLPVRTENSADFAALLEADPGTAESEPKEVPDTVLPLPDVEIQPDPGFTAAVDDLPVTENLSLDVDPATSGLASGFEGQDISGETNTLPTVGPHTGGQTNRLPKVKASETNQLPKTADDETKTTHDETNRRAKAHAVIQRHFHRHSGLSLNLQTLLELQASGDRERRS